VVEAVDVDSSLSSTPDTSSTLDVVASEELREGGLGTDESDLSEVVSGDHSPNDGMGESLTANEEPVLSDEAGLGPVADQESNHDIRLQQPAEPVDVENSIAEEQLFDSEEGFSLPEAGQDTGKTSQETSADAPSRELRSHEDVLSHESLDEVIKTNEAQHENQDAPISVLDHDDDIHAAKSSIANEGMPFDSIGEPPFSEESSVSKGESDLCEDESYFQGNALAPLSQVAEEVFEVNPELTDSAVLDPAPASSSNHGSSMSHDNDGDFNRSLSVNGVTTELEEHSHSFADQSQDELEPDSSQKESLKDEQVGTTPQIPYGS
jgi:hypothetical protein